MGEVCEEKGLSVGNISLRGGMSPSNIYALMHSRTKCLKISTLYRFCEGAEIPLSKFFDSALFENLEDAE